MTVQAGPRARRLADALRSLVVASAATWLLTGNDDAALAIALILPTLVALRLLATPGKDLLGCTLTGVAQVGSGLGLTGTLPWWDVLAHAAVAAVTVLVLRDHMPLGSALGCTALLALGWEALEGGVDALAGTDFSPSLGDTFGDLAADAVGALLLAASAMWVRARRPRERVA